MELDPESKLFSALQVILKSCKLYKEAYRDGMKRKGDKIGGIVT